MNNLYVLQTPVIQPSGVVTVNFNGEEGTKITIKITKKDTSQPSTVSDVKVKACTEGRTKMLKNGRASSVKQN